MLLTGASSFTGCHFARRLAREGWEVVVTMTRGDAGAYGDGVRGRRVGLVVEAASEVLWGVRFDDDRFVEAAADGFDVLCHHGADVRDYKSESFDVVGAVSANAASLNGVLDGFAGGGGRRVVLSGSVFEGGEGAGDGGLPHFSPYGLSKSLTDSLFRFACARRGLRYGKFVIPNPFGPCEEPRFTAYLMKTWLAGEVASVRTPVYVRDNIHVDLLARCYAAFVGGLPPDAGESRVNPSGYVESQGAFAERFASAVRARTSLVCGLELGVQAVFDEPRVRVNVDPAASLVDGWDEGAAWDACVAYYVG